MVVGRPPRAAAGPLAGYAFARRFLVVEGMTAERAHLVLGLDGRSMIEHRAAAGPLAGYAFARRFLVVEGMTAERAHQILSLDGRSMVERTGRRAGQGAGCGPGGPPHIEHREVRR